MDEQLNAIKGGGACQFQEKVVAEAAKKFVIIAGRKWKNKNKKITKKNKSGFFFNIPLVNACDIETCFIILDYRKKSTKLGIEVQ